MASVAEPASWRDRLLAARFSGLRAVQDSNGERIEYNADAELARAIAAAEGLIAAAASRPITPSSM